MKHWGIIITFFGALTLPLMLLVAYHKPDEKYIKAVVGSTIWLIVGLSMWRYGKRLEKEKADADKAKAEKRSWHYSAPRE